MPEAQVKSFTPEEMLGQPSSPLLEISLRCKQCGRVSRERFEWACIHPDTEGCWADGWDGIYFSCIFRCAGCAALDDYDLAPGSYRELTRGMVRGPARGGAERIIIAESRLWDGTVVRRPAQALARVRELARLHAGTAEAHRRHGNLCQRLGLVEEAEAAWRRAVEVDAGEVEARCSLAEVLLGRTARTPEALELLNDALAAAAPRSGDRVPRSESVRAFFTLLYPLAQGGHPLALRAAWAAGKIKGGPVVCMSGVDLRRVLGVWDRLIDFAASPDVFGLSLAPATREDEATTLEALLLRGGGPAPERVPDRPRPVTAGPRVGRNAPCTCGSGRKYKLCCGA